MTAPLDAQTMASRRLTASRARLSAQLLAPAPALAADQRLAIDLLQVAVGADGADPAASAMRWVSAVADQRLGDPVREHPWTAMGLGLGAGVLIALARPWRWRLSSPLLLALTTQLALPLLARQSDRTPR
jgi:hypothetical protein